MKILEESRIFHNHNVRLRLFLLGLFFLSALGIGLRAENLTPEQILKIRQLYDLRLSPNGGHIALTVSEPIKGSKQDRNIWVIDVKSRSLRQFTASPQVDTHPRWCPCGKKLAFLSDRSEKSQIYLIRMEGGEAQPLTESKTGVQAFEWSPDGRKIAFLAKEPETKEEEQKKKEKDDARVVDLDEKYPQLWIIDVESGKVRQITKGRWRISEFKWMSQGKSLILSATDHPQPELFTTKIYQLNISEGQMKLIYAPAGPFHSLKVAGDGKTVAFIGSRKDGPEARDIFLLNLPEGKVQNLTARSIDRLVQSFLWEKDGSLLALVQTGFRSSFYRVQRNGRAEKIKDFETNPARSFVVGPDFLAFVGQTATEAPELWLSTSAGQAEQISHLNKNWDKVTLIKPEIIHYPSFDGTEIEAALFKPVKYQTGKRVSLVVLVHGGPTGAWTDRFQAWAQLLAARGMAVLCPNVRGSTGYGNEFLEMNRRDWGGGDFKDVMAGVDFLIKRGLADPDRLGIGGWSYGGYMAAWAVTQTDRFKAAVSGAPMTDLASEYGTESNSINSYDTWFMGTPYEDLDLFIDRSPVTYVKKVKTPTLLLCGEKDTTDPIGQCQQFYRGLRRYGVETEFVVYPREGHGIREEKHRLDVLKRMLDWFEKYLK